VAWKIKMNNKFLFFAVVLAAIVALAVISYSIFIGIKAPSPFTIYSVYPQRDSLNVKLSSRIAIVFSRPLIEAEKTTVKINISPKTESTVFWENGNTSAAIKPLETLFPETGYIITVSYNNSQTFSWSFKTQKTVSIPSPTPTPFSEENSLLNQQGQSDLKFAQSQKQFLETHPWYNNLPPENNQYFINYDASKNDFFVILYPKKTSSLSIDNQVSQLKTNVLQALQTLGINTALYKIEWTIIPR
jgi:hypothetical protein